MQYLKYIISSQKGAQLSHLYYSRIWLLFLTQRNKDCRWISWNEQETFSKNLPCMCFFHSLQEIINSYFFQESKRKLFPLPWRIHRIWAPKILWLIHVDAPILSLALPVFYFSLTWGNTSSVDVDVLRNTDSIALGLKLDLQ
jgi:hypothetical protein